MGLIKDAIKASIYRSEISRGLKDVIKEAKSKDDGTIVCSYCGRHFNKGGGVCKKCNPFYNLNQGKAGIYALRTGIICSKCMKDCKKCKRIFCPKHLKKHKCK